MFLHKNNIIWLTFYRLLLSMDNTALYLRSGKLQREVYTMK